jgi:hypothetical protein
MNSSRVLYLILTLIAWESASLLTMDAKEVGAPLFARFDGRGRLL